MLELDKVNYQHKDKHFKVKFKKKSVIKKYEIKN